MQAPIDVVPPGEDAVWLFADDFDAPADLISAAEDMARAHLKN